jgi:hypothetical protein
MPFDSESSTRPSGPLNPGDVLVLQSSAVRFKKIQRAIGYAKFNGVTMIVFGSVALLSGLDSVLALGVGAALVSCGIFELRQRARLKQLEPSSPFFLGINQIAAAIAVTIYCLLSMLNPTAIDIPPELASAPEVADTLVEAQAIASKLMSLVYIATMGVTWFFQLIAVWFYLSRRNHLRLYLTQSPAWVHDLQRKGLLQAA